jgi:hypothetical protein
MEGVTGSIPVAPTSLCLLRSCLELGEDKIRIDRGLAHPGAQYF